MNWLLIICVLILIWRIADGFKKGMVKEIISFVSLIILSITAVLLGSAILNYMEKDMTSLVVAIVLLVAVAIAHRVLSLFFFSAKLISKLPVVNLANKLCGVFIGILETVLIIWMVFTLLITVDTGIIGQQILVYVQESRLLTFLYEYNYLALWVGMITDKLAMLPLA